MNGCEEGRGVAGRIVRAQLLTAFVDHMLDCYFTDWTCFAASRWHLGQLHQKPYSSRSILRLSSLSSVKFTYGSVNSSPGCIRRLATMVNLLVPLIPGPLGGGGGQGS